MREVTEFKNEPLTDFGAAENRRAMEQALQKVATQLGRSYRIVIGGRDFDGDGTFASTNPSQPDQVVGTFPNATAELAGLAVKAAHEAFGSWSRRPARERAEILL